MGKKSKKQSRSIKPAKQPARTAANKAAKKPNTSKKASAKGDKPPKAPKPWGNSTGTLRPGSGSELLHEPPEYQLPQHSPITPDASRSNEAASDPDHATGFMLGVAALFASQRDTTTPSGVVEVLQDNPGTETQSWWSAVRGVGTAAVDSLLDRLNEGLNDT